MIESFITPAPLIHSAIILAELFPSPKSRVNSWMFKVETVVKVGVFLYYIRKNERKKTIAVVGRSREMLRVRVSSPPGAAAI